MTESFCGFTTPEFFSEVQQHFHFLLDTGFRIVEEESAPTHSSRMLVLGKRNLCVEVSHEQSDVGVFFYPTSDGKIKGIGIGELVTFLDLQDGKPSKELGAGRFGPELDWNLDDRTRIVAGLDWYSSLLHRYIDRIEPFFESENFKQNEAGLEKWKNLWQKQIRNAYENWLHNFQRNPESFFPNHE